MRRHKAVLTGAGLLCAGFLYGYVLIPLGFRLPCPLRRITGLRCPGCGITDLCLGLLHGRFVPSCNWGLVLAAPGILWLLWSEQCRRQSGKGLAWALVVFLLAWAVLRNLWGI